ncbi:hypothetical protein Poli38472_007945 [Pythium oligandrum]|uniref:Uncharacterized protein n=1 Tax=Pythium oligandrum TaxID=41045 RepID=A0A8K1CN19_PYTOL|nr:hypothetical protein Poli38472_007945 [Pythium oligandrum]|eukprot:TMW65303.1 hypothetical protein Poli38472_007945 [Pythium oligandrum]
MIVLAFQAVPLGDPRLGPDKNITLFIWSAVAHTVLAFSFIMAMKQALRLNDVAYPLWKAVLIAAIPGVGNEIIWAAVAFSWRFPVPYRELTGAATWGALLVLGHYILLRPVLSRRLSRLKRYVPVVRTQFTLLFCLLGLSMVFVRASHGVQVLMILVFPIFKTYASVGCGLGGALYQTVCMQLLTSYSLALLLMGGDLVQAIVEVWMYAVHDFLVDGPSTLPTAAKIVDSALFPGAVDVPTKAMEEEKPRLSVEFVKADLPGKPRRSSWQGFERKKQPSTRRRSRLLAATDAPRAQRGRGRRHSSPTAYQVRSSASVFLRPADYRNQRSSRRLLDLKRHVVMTGVFEFDENGNKRTDTGVLPTAPQPSRVMIDGIVVTRKDQARILEQTLQLLFSLEYLVFIEFVEFFVPLLFSIITTVSWYLPNAQYNTVLCAVSENQMLNGLQYALIYSGLELLTFVALCVVIKKKYGINVLWLLSFVLESYAMTLQGKLIGSFITIVNLAIIHQGVDFSSAISSWTRTQGTCISLTN